MTEALGNALPIIIAGVVLGLLVAVVRYLSDAADHVRRIFDLVDDESNGGDETVKAHLKKLVTASEAVAVALREHHNWAIRDAREHREAHTDGGREDLRDG